MIDHVIAVEFTVPEESFYGVKHGIRPRSILSPSTGNTWSLGMLSICRQYSLFIILDALQPNFGCKCANTE